MERQHPSTQLSSFNWGQTTMHQQGLGQQGESLFVKERAMIFQSQNHPSPHLDTLFSAISGN